MRVGFSYDLKDDYRKLGHSEEAIAEFDSEETIGAIEKAIQANGHEVERIGNIRQLTTYLAQGKKWDFVFNIAEGLNGLAREAQIPALLEAFEQPYTFSPAEVMIVTLDKSLAKLKIAQAGLPTAKWTVVANSSELPKVDMAFPLFIKPVAEGTGKGISAKSLVTHKAELESEAKNLLERFGQPVLIESYLPGREFTVGIVGNGKTAQVLGVMEIISLPGAEMGGHTFHNKENCKTLMKYKIATDEVAKLAGQLALDSWKALGCLDVGRVDIRCDEKQNPHFLEVNPLPGLNPVHSDISILCSENGIKYQEMMNLILGASISRLFSKVDTKNP